MRRIAVTGATGFLGQHLVARLVAQGDHVVALGRDRARAAALVSAEIALCDLRDAAGLAARFAGCDAVVHSAALCTPWASTADYVASNVRATENVVRACREADVPTLVHISTPSIFADTAHRLGVKEDDSLPRRFATEYARTKWLAEQVVRASDRRAIVLRPQGIYGPHDPSVLPRLLRAGTGRAFPLLDRGEAIVDLTHVDDVVESIVCALRSPRASGPYHVTSGDPRPVHEIVRLLFAAVGQPLSTRSVPFALAYAAGACVETAHRLFAPSREPILTRYTALLVGRSRTLDITRARVELGYVPRVRLADGLSSFARSWRSHDVAAADLVPRVGSLHAP